MKSGENKLTKEFNCKSGENVVLTKHLNTKSVGNKLKHKRV